MISLRVLQTVTGPSLNQQLLNTRIWPKLAALQAKPWSVRALANRLSAAAEEINSFDKSNAVSSWKSVSKPALIEDLRVRVRDAAVMQQRDTMFCGPVSLLFELARRRPREYVTMARGLFENGRYTTPEGRVFEVDDDLLASPFPGPNNSGEMIANADWMAAAALRDDENWFWDVDADKSKSGLAGGLTTVAEMAAWTADLLGLKVTVERPDLGFLGEPAMIRNAVKTVEAGGVAFLCVDGAVIKSGTDDDEEDLRWRKTTHTGNGTSEPSKWTHSRDDFLVATHWIVLLGNLVEKNSRMTIRVWSWGGEYELEGTLDALGEYLHATVLGRV